jgi:hypothetical protein
MSIRFVALALFAAAPMLSACDGGDAPAASSTIAAGEVETRSFTAADFTRVVAAGSDRVIIRRGSSFSVSARGRAGLLDRLTVRVEDGELRLGRESGIDWGGNAQLGNAVITVTMPRLEGITLAGSGEVRADRLDGGAASLTLAGSGNLTVSDGVVDTVEMTLAGSGDMVLLGRARSADITVAGSGDIEGTSYGVQTADITVAGSGGVTMRVTQSADISVIGSGDVNLSGGARCQITRRGSGDARCSP